MKEKVLIYTATSFQKFYFSKRIGVGHQNDVFSRLAYIVSFVSCLAPKRFFSVVVCVYRSVDTEGHGGIALYFFAEVVCRGGLHYTLQSSLNSFLPNLQSRNITTQINGMQRF